MGRAFGLRCPLIGLNVWEQDYLPRQGCVRSNRIERLEDSRAKIHCPHLLIRWPGIVDAIQSKIVEKFLLTCAGLGVLWMYQEDEMNHWQLVNDFKGQTIEVYNGRLVEIIGASVPGMVFCKSVDGGGIISEVCTMFLDWSRVRSTHV